jgi:hypothetical protein
MSSFYAQQMERIALIHDLASNPELVQKERNSIRAGSYPIQKQVKDELMATNGDYRRLAKAFGDMRAEIKAMKRPARASAGKDDHDMQVGIFTLDRMMLRQFQARIFWREGR